MSLFWTQRFWLHLLLLSALSLAHSGAGEEIDLEVIDEGRDRRIPIRTFLSPTEVAAPEPVVLFSHGLGGSREGNAYLGHHWSEQGYVAVFLQHIGSDDSVWKGAARAEVMNAMRAAASGENFLARVRDVSAVLDQLEKWNGEEGHPLRGRLDLSRVAMSGHSFGAVTTQAVMGMQSAGGQQPFLEERIDAAIAFSPSSPSRGTPEQTYGAVTIPVLTMTGTLDGDPLRNRFPPEDRQKVYAALPEGDKFQLVFEGGRHSAFSDRVVRHEPPRDTRIHPAVLTITTAFFDAYLRGDAEAKSWLQSEGPRSLLIDEDLWEWK